MQGQAYNNMFGCSKAVLCKYCVIFNDFIIEILILFVY